MVTASVADQPLGEDQVARDYTPPRLLAQAVLEYPVEAEAEDAHGNVNIEVVVDATGAVVGVEIIDGPSVFHDEARAAGYRLSFAPATLDGEAVPATVKVVFHFAPPAVAEPSTEVVVIGDLDRTDTRARTTLGAAKLEQAAGADLAGVLSQVSGVEASRGQGNTAKPIIRGQTERRLLLLVDGVRHENQKWGADHAPEIDPFSAGTVSVVKGAAGARYGPDAIGGVVVVEPPALRETAGVGGRALVTGATNGWGGAVAARLDAVPSEGSPWSFRVNGSATRSASQRAPDYVLGNTATSGWTLGGAARFRDGRTTWRLSLQHLDQRAGVFFGVGAATTPEELLSRLDAPPTGADQWRSSFRIERPSKAVSHDRATLHVDRQGKHGGALRAIYGVQYNQRREFDRVRDTVERAQFDFSLQTHSLEAVAEHAPTPLGGASLAGGVGVQGVARLQVYEGLPLLPNYVGIEGGLFGWERLRTGGPVEVEVGARLDRVGRTAFVAESQYELGVREAVFVPDKCIQPGNRYRCAEAWTAASVSAGGLWHLVPDAVDWKLDVSSASRVPGPDEQYLVGSAPTLPVYAVGNGSLGIETTWNASTTLGVRLPWLEGEVSAWGSLVDDYIYFAPVLGPSGEPRIDVTIRGSWPRFGHEAVPARFHGADGTVSLGPTGVVGADLSASMVRAVRRDTGAFLVGTPPDRGRLALWLRLRPSPTLRRLHVGASLQGVAKQTRTDLAAELAPPPEGVVLLGATIEATVRVADTPVRIGVTGHNLTNAVYRDYTSLFRYYGDFPGRDVRVRVATDF